MVFCQNTFMWRAPKWHWVRTLFILVILWSHDGSRPNLIGSYESAFHKDFESGLNSKMAIGTNVGNSQNTAEVGFWFKFEKNRGFITKPLQKVLIRKSNRAFTWMIWPPPPPFLPLALLTLLWPSGACLSCVLKVWSRTIFYSVDLPQSRIGVE